jgi:hypothetical protein
VTDLYERYQIVEFLAEDAKKLKAFLAPAKRTEKKVQPKKGVRLA